MNQKGSLLAIKTELPGGPPSSRPRLPWMIGREAAEHRDVLLHIAADLGAGLSPERARQASAIADRLSSHCYSIAVTGHHEVGLSRVVAALGQLPDALPEHQPKKSAIVTQLHFGAPDGRSSGADVRLFGSEDWRALEVACGANHPLLGGSERAALSHRLARQVEEMRTRAFMRLGNKFHDLIGQQITLDDARPQYLSRYLGSAQSGTGEPVAEPARYADMTSAVALFHEAGGFALPATLIATPGFDESFAVRTERSLASVASADMCVVVISAGAPLSKPDKRMLGDLLPIAGDRMVVFLDTGSGQDGESRVDPRALAGAVDALCQSAQPDRPVPVVLGSSRAALEGLASAHSGGHNGHGGGHGGHNGHGGGPGAQATARAQLHATGLPTLAAAVNDRLFWGGALSAHLTAADALEEIARAEFDAIERDISIIRRVGVSVSADAKDARGHTPFDAAEETIAETAAAAETGIASAMSELWAKMRSDATRKLREEALGIVRRLDAEAELSAAGIALADRLRAACPELAETHSAVLAAPLAAAHRALSAALSEIGARAELTSPAPLASETEIERILAPLFGVSADELPGAACARPGKWAGTAMTAPEEAMRQLMAPHTTKLETAIEEITLALGKAAREAAADLAAEARRALSAHRAALGKADHLDGLVAAASRLEGQADAIAAFRLATS